MATGTPTRSTARTQPRGAAPLSGVFLLLWIAFSVALIFSQATLDSVWHWMGTLPLVGQIILWVLFLPVVVGLWIWESDWALWVRLVLIFAIAVGNIAALSARPPAHRPGHTTEAVRNEGEGGTSGLGAK